MIDTDLIERNRQEPSLPFTLLVAAEWYTIEEAPSENDGAVFYQREVEIGGDLATTQNGADLSFTHIRITP
ncbi:MAG: hypothetical protein AAF633_21165 [Chloroflexota bacterium]